jgi:hypothetical protein
MTALLIVCRLILPWSGETLEQRAFLISGAEESAMEESCMDADECASTEEEICAARGMAATWPLEAEGEIMDLEGYATAE